jgi:hypothetical protein
LLQPDRAINAAATAAMIGVSFIKAPQ